MITPDQTRELLDLFPDADLSIIESIIYDNGWSGYEDSAWLIIFEGIDGSTQALEYSSCSMCDGETSNTFTPREINDYEMEELVLQMESDIAENANS
jgi:hypothetical protein